MEKEVRRASTYDIEGLLDLVRRYHAFDGHPFDETGVKSALEPLLAGSPYGLVWVLSDGTSLSGYIILTLGWSLEFGGQDAFIDEAFVAEDDRGKGYGRRLFAEAEAEAVHQGVKYIHLEVTAENEIAREHYIRWGYVDHGRTLMTKRLASLAERACPSQGL